MAIKSEDLDTIEPVLLQQPYHFIEKTNLDTIAQYALPTKTIQA